ncbi:protein O-mannosyltransferase 1 [Hyalella azteca]|uniref:Protein O-mannosyltransferase 1 n=1 Tax=Hyalella azteca TaxID=294128 RepID=A0A8B7PEP4_HYAAZ|nr:protein O-mannosyltransferase 1 [Hyalella azteca]
METDTRNRKKKPQGKSTVVSKSDGIDDDSLKRTVAEKLKSVNPDVKRDAGDGESAPETPPPEFAPDAPDAKDVAGPEKPLKSKSKKHQSNGVHKEASTAEGGPAISIQMDIISATLFMVSFAIRLWRLDHPKGIVFDELHYGKYAGHYLQNTFFFDSQPPFGKQMIALAAYIAGYDGSFKFDRIGGPYDATVPVFAMRLVPAFFGALLSPTVYKLMQELGSSQPAALLAAVLIVLDNAVVIQTRYILLEGPLLFFGLAGVLCVLRLRRYYKRPFSLPWFLYLIGAAVLLTAAACVRYFGLFSFMLGVGILTYDFWEMVGDRSVADRQLLAHCLTRTAIFISIPVTLYLSCFYVHLSLLYKAGPNDNIMTSAFQASLEGGLAAIIANQPMQVVHGSQVTLRHSHNRACWLHSHDALYPQKYADGRGSSHQQQVTCYSYKDVNNWWIVKKPQNEELVVGEPLEPIKHGDVVQLVHGLTSRALNSHDVASAMSPHNQEVSCYVDHNVSMPAQNLWRVELLDPDRTKGMWHAVESQLRLVHVNSSTALKFSGRQLPEWGFKQHEVVTDKIFDQEDVVWNVEEHRYSRTENQKEREKELISSEMIPTERRELDFWSKLYELQYKMLFNNQENVAGHMYASDPVDWLTLKRGVAYWIDSESNAQIHFVGNIVTWLSGTASLVFFTALFILYILRRQRSCYDIPEDAWDNFCNLGQVLGGGYLVHYLPYFLVDRTLFLHHYMPAYIYKLCLLAAVVEHVHYFLRHVLKQKILSYAFLALVGAWLAAILYVFSVFLPLTYGHVALTANQVDELTWRDSWDLIVHK